MTIKNKFNIEDEVYLKTDADQSKRIVTGITIKPGLLLVYELSCGEETTSHYEFEISDEEDKVLKTK